jgi:thioredoxin-dependent peroxiredoxin
MVFKYTSMLALLLLVSLAIEGKAKEMKLKVGDNAPNFKLKDEKGQFHSLTDYRGQKVALYFYPKDDTPGCTKEACSFRDGYKALQDAGIVILGVSYDSPESHEKFKEKYNLPFTLLSDEKKEAAKAYGANGGLMGSLVAQRKTFLIDEQGKIVKIFDKVDVSEHADEVLQAFAANEQK